MTEVGEKMMDLEKDRCANCCRKFNKDTDGIRVIPVASRTENDEMGEGSRLNLEADCVGNEYPVSVLKAMSIVYGFPLENLTQEKEDGKMWRKDDECGLCENCGKVAAAFYRAFQELRMLAHEASYISKGLVQLHECIQKAFSDGVAGKVDSSVKRGCPRGRRGKHKGPVSTFVNKKTPAVTNKCDDGNTKLLPNEETPFDLEIVKVETVLPVEQIDQDATPNVDPIPTENVKRKKKKAEVPFNIEEMMAGTTEIISPSGKIIRTSTRTRKVKTPDGYGESLSTCQKTSSLEQRVGGKKQKMDKKKELSTREESQEPVHQIQATTIKKEISTKSTQPSKPRSKPKSSSSKPEIKESSKSARKQARIRIRKKYTKMSNNLPIPEKQFKCEHCNKKFLMKATYEKHLTSHENQKVRCRCTVCNQMLPTVLSLIRHLACVHDAKEKVHLDYSCPKCPSRSFGTYNQLKLHYEETHRSSLNFCIKCGKFFTSSFNLRRHYQNVHAMEPPATDGESEEHRNIIKQEASDSHIEDFLQDLDSPDKKNTEQGEIKRMNPEDKISPTGIFKCNQCGKEFKRRHKLNLHILFHNGSEPRFGCSECPKKFFKAQGLRTHLLVHTMENPLLCKQCDKVFERRDHFRRHMEVVHGQKRKGKKGSEGEKNNDSSHACPECKKSFSRKEYLRLHMRIHTGEKPHICDKCGKQFSDPRNLVQHLVTHKTDRPFCCSVCGLTFKRAHHLNDHEGTHRQDVARPFVCTFAGCEKAFKLRKHLNTHELVHTGSKDHSCHVCGRAFSRKDNLRQHINKLHGKKLADELLVVVEEQRERHRQAQLEQQESLTNASSSDSGQMSEILQIIPTDMVTTTTITGPLSSIASTLASTSTFTKFSYS